MPNIIPPNNIVAGDTRHVSFHNDTSDVLTNHKTRIEGLEAAFPTMRGYVGAIEDLPDPGALGDMYVVGEDMALYYWGIKDPNPAPQWHFSGSIRGEQGAPGPSGTIIGILANGVNPPPGTPSNSLWWVADAGVVVPGPDYTPTLVGTSGWVTNALSGTVPVNAAGINTQAGDVAVLCVAHASGTALATPTNWENPTALDAAYTRTIDSNLTATIFTRVCPDGMGGIPLTTSAKHSASLMVFRNVQLGAGGVLDKMTSTISNTASTTQTAPTVTPTENAIVAGFYFDRVNQTADPLLSVTQPTEFTKAADTAISKEAGTNQVSTQGGYDLSVEQDAARPAGTQNWVRSVSAGRHGAFTFALLKRTA